MSDNKYSKYSIIEFSANIANGCCLKLVAAFVFSHHGILLIASLNDFIIVVISSLAFNNYLKDTIVQTESSTISDESTGKGTERDLELSKIFC